MLISIFLATEWSKWISWYPLGFAFQVSEVDLLDMAISMGTYLDLFYFTAIWIVIPLIVFFIFLSDGDNSWILLDGDFIFFGWSISFLFLVIINNFRFIFNFLLILIIIFMIKLLFIFLLLKLIFFKMIIFFNTLIN
jgi:hypothetical protein